MLSIRRALSGDEGEWNTRDGSVLDEVQLGLMLQHRLAQNRVDDPNKDVSLDDRVQA